MPMLSPGETATPPVEIRPGESYANPPDAYDTAAVFPSGFTVSDVLRYAVALSDFSEIRCLLDMMEAPEDTPTT